jgi:hypothetical protein
VKKNQHRKKSTPAPYKLGFILKADLQVDLGAQLEIDGKTFETVSFDRLKKNLAGKSLFLIGFFLSAMHAC